MTMYRASILEKTYPKENSTLSNVEYDCLYQSEIFEESIQNNPGSIFSPRSDSLLSELFLENKPNSINMN